MEEGKLELLLLKGAGVPTGKRHCQVTDPSTVTGSREGVAQEHRGHGTPSGPLRSL